MYVTGTAKSFSWRSTNKFQSFMFKKKASFPFRVIQCATLKLAELIWYFGKEGYRFGNSNLYVFEENLLCSLSILQEQNFWLMF